MGQKFKVVVLIPEVPSFTGDIKDSTSIKTTLSAQYRTINRGGHSIYEELRKQGIEPLVARRVLSRCRLSYLPQARPYPFLSFALLRSYQCPLRAPMPFLLHKIGSDLVFQGSFMKQMEEKSGVTVNQAQIALARRWIGDVSNGRWHQTEIAIATGVSGLYERDAGDVADADGSTGISAKQSSVSQLPFEIAKEKTETTGPITVTVPVPDAQEAEKVLKQFEHAKDGLLPEHPIADSVAHHALESPNGLLDEKWLGTPEEEKAA